MLDALECPYCHTKIFFQKRFNFCHYSLPSFGNRQFISFLSQMGQHVKTVEAYRLYSIFYAPIALFVYTIIWRGNIFTQIRFFRRSLEKNKSIVDLATGDGSLTRAALFSNRKLAPDALVAIDLSEEMLKRAIKKLPAYTVMIKGDVLALPFASASLPMVTCFGGFNSFQSAATALCEIRRVLNPNGLLRGSVLLLPTAKWKQRKISAWIQKGYQTQTVSLEEFESWLFKADLVLTEKKRVGDVLLFEAARN